MANGTLLSPIALSPSQLSQPAANLNAAFPLANLLDPSVKTVARSTTVASSFQLDIDLGADTAINQLYLGGTNASSAATLEIRAATAAQGAAYLSNAGAIVRAASALRVNGSAGPQYDALWWQAATISRRYVRVTVADSTNAAGYVQAAVLALGAVFQPARNFSWDSGPLIVDESPKSRARSGHLDVDPWAIGEDFEWTWEYLSDAERLTLKALLRSVGKSRPCLLVEDPAATTGLGEMIWWGLLDDIQRVRRRRVNRNAVGLRITKLI